MAYKVAPLNSSFMLTAILGFLVSLIWVYPQAQSWGIAFALVFGLMFISSVVSATYGDPDLELKLDKKAVRKKRKKKK
jgi:uncharacterized protein (DUF58 family)